MFGFTEIIGHEGITRSLQNALAHGTVPHAYIFAGERGTGKTLMAKSFAKALLCQSPEGNASCGVCVSCRTFESGNNPDMIYVTASKAKGIGVDDIREQVGANLETAPYSHNNKVLVIEDAMTPAAQNALLKSIEEPPPFAVFLLTAVNVSGFLPTVLSRCVTLKLGSLPDADVTAYLHRQGLTYEKALLYGVYARGSIGRALELSHDEAFVAMRAEVLDIVKSLRGTDICGAFLMFPRLAAYKDTIDHALSIMYLWYRDALVAAEGAERFLLQADIKNDIAREAEECSVKTLFAKIEAVATARERLRQNANFQLTLELMLCGLACKG